MSAITHPSHKCFFSSRFLMPFLSSVLFSSAAALVAQTVPATLTLSTNSPTNEVGVNVTVTAKLTPSFASGQSADGSPIIFVVTKGAAKPTQQKASLHGGGASMTTPVSGPLSVSASFAATPVFAATTSLNTLYFDVGRITTTLDATSKGSAVDTIASGQPVTLTATVQSSIPAGARVTHGQVNFCIADAASCTGIHLVGTAQLTNGGSAAISLIPGIGDHTYKAIFIGTNSNPESVSNIAVVSVTGLHPTTTTIASSGKACDYSLKATVAGTAGTTSPTGPVSFVDFSNASRKLASASLGSPTTSLSFSAKAPANLDEGPSYITVADVNGDGIPDVLGVDSYDFLFNALLGKGDGTFTAMPALNTGTNPVELVVGDFNRDGKPDVATINSAATTIGQGTVSVFLGKGDGTFTLQSSPAVGSFASSIAMADFNGDGILDLATISESDSAVTILLGKGDGTFTATPNTTSLESGPTWIASGDFNADGKADLVVVTDTNSIIVLVGRGDGTFMQLSETPAGLVSPDFVTVGDFNGDGKEDLAVANNASSGTVTILLGEGNGDFTSDKSYTTGANPVSIAIGDFNNDGKPDLAVVSSNLLLTAPASNITTVLLGKGDGTFTQLANMTTGTDPVSVATGDMNGDGVVDFVVADSVGPSLFLGAAVSYLSQLTHAATATANAVAVSGTGNHQVRAIYPGGGDYTGSQSATTPVAATPACP